jgi:hypothetical protein
MSTSLVVPAASKIAPQIPVAKNQSGTETNAAVQASAKEVVTCKLRKKNRRGKQMVIIFPGARTELESGTNYTLQGFSPDVDAVTAWTLDALEIRLSKKGGETTAHFHAVLGF